MSSAATVESTPPLRPQTTRPLPTCSRILAVVSSTAVARPLAGGANYAAVKAATEAWARAVAQGFAKGARDSGAPLAAASVIFRVKSLDGLEDALAQRFADLWASEAAEVNDTIVELTDPAL